MPIDAGVIGSTFRRGTATDIRGVIDSEDYLAATLAVVDEVCAPIVAEGHVVGALNVESTTSLPNRTRWRSPSRRQRPSLIASSNSAVQHRSRQRRCWLDTQPSSLRPQNPGS